MGSYAMPSGGDEPRDGADGESSGLGDLLSGRLSDVDVDSVAVVRDERERQ